MRTTIAILAALAALTVNAQSAGDPKWIFKGAGVPDQTGYAAKVNSTFYGINGSGSFALIPQSGFQGVLVSGTNIKTVNGNSLLGSGDLVFVVDGITNGITGSAPSQNAVFDALALKADATHVHAASDITSGTMATARLGSGTANSGAYLRGDQTWQTLNAAAVSGLGTLATQNGTFSGTSSGTNTGDQASIVGITGSLAEFNAALTGADFATGGGTVTGTNTGDQTITLTGDVTGSGTGSFAATIGSGKVTFAKMQSVNMDVLLGHPTVGTGVVQEITCTAAGRALLDDASNTVQRATLAAAPLSATYITQTANSELSGEQALGSLGTGIVKNTTTTGVLSIAVAGDFPTLNQSTTGSAATLTTARAIYGNNFDGSAALTQIIASTFGGTGNGFTKFTGPTTSEKTFTLPNSSETLLYAGGPGGTPSSMTATNLTGTASGLSIGGNAATVSTNANLTGVVTSTGNATAIADGALSIAKTSGLQTAIDAKVADAINDGTTTIAPSENAVFDALALKMTTTDYAPVFMNYSGGSQANSTTSYADVHASAAFTISATGTYEVVLSIAYDAAATTTGVGLALNGPGANFSNITVDYGVLSTDRSSVTERGYDWAGAIAPSSAGLSGNVAGMVARLRFTTTGTLSLRFKSEVGASAITVTSVTGYIRRIG